MIARIAGAVTRGTLVALVVAMPSLLLAGYMSDTSEMVVLIAILAGVLTFAEYNTDFPSFIEFRDAPPVNRIRFIALFVMFASLSLAAKHQFEPTAITGLVHHIGGLIGRFADFPFSPVRLVLLLLPEGTAEQTINSVRIAAGVTYTTAVVSVLFFLFSVRVLGWPISSGAFNVWVNLPLFDPTTGGDVVHRLQRDGRINIIVGFLLPFIFPALIKIASEIVDPISLDSPLTVIWCLSAWAFLPASMVMRGIAISRISDLIREKRRRVYASAESMQAA
ncbi:hypothetical protein [Heliomarina baculiformis]|uniref:hypothetical protein n=1 Tax=Heliomarina baculiformis TaxID=2872036 RepID=UPI001EE2147C